MNPSRCHACPACEHVNRVKPTILRTANPPFSHTNDDCVRVWNQTLFDNPCEKWPPEVRQLADKQLLSLAESIRPIGNRYETLPQS